MLESITVKNLALIQESEVELAEGLNILTGETGAGKSIILGSIKLALGERARGDIIRNGESYGSVELVFASKSNAVSERMKELDIPLEEDGIIIIKRKITEGRSVCKCNGETISNKDLKSLASLLINIHGQRDTLELLDADNYLEILDEYAGEDMDDLLQENEISYKKYTDLKNELLKEEKQGENQKDIALAEFEIQEIRNARLTLGEDEELEKRYRQLNNSSKITEVLSKAFASLNNNGAVADLIAGTLRECSNALQYSDLLEEIVGDFSGMEEMVRDTSRKLQGLIDSMEFSREEYANVESRLDTINRLKNRYGNTLRDIEKYACEREYYLEKMSNHKEYLENLKKKTEAAESRAYACAQKCSAMRKKKALDLQHRMIENLKELNFDSVNLEIVVDNNQELTARGCDSVDFKVSFNVGEPVKSLSQIASGGELSRFMLALKAATSGRDQVETMIFDEIDSGISGATAWSVAEKMGYLSRKHQVIAITHLPQMAAMADCHFYIKKRVENNSTITDIYRLDRKESIREVARLLSTGEITEALEKGALELKERAEQVMESYTN